MANSHACHYLLDDNGEETSDSVLEHMEKIDDDCDKYGIQFVKIDDKKANKEYGIDKVSCREKISKLLNWKRRTFRLIYKLKLNVFNFKMSVINITVSEVRFVCKLCVWTRILQKFPSTELFVWPLVYSLHSHKLYISTSSKNKPASHKRTTICPSHSIFSVSASIQY